VRIRTAVTEDVAAVVAMEREVVEAPHWGESVYTAMVSGEGSGVRRCLLVAEVDGMLVGFAVGRAIGKGLAAELESVVVAQEWRRGGVGRALCEGVIAWCRQGGAAEVELEVRSASRGARALYERLGFEWVGVRKDYYREPLDDAVLMRLAIK